MSSDTKTGLEATFKSKDTEEWLDIKFYRPMGYWWAKQFDKLNIHPNVVTVISILFGVLAAVCFYFQTIWWIIAGICSLIYADVLDSADGQLARMTGKKTLWGRILDGFAGDIWFFSIYLSILLNMYHQQMPLGIDREWGIWAFVLIFSSGVFCHSVQAQLADYYRNIYLLFHNDKSELNSSSELAAEQRSTPWTKWFWKIWLFFYQRYTEAQERRTPQFQRMMKAISKKYGDVIPPVIRDMFCSGTFHLLKWTNVLSFNTRAIVLSLSLLAREAWVYFVFEAVVLSAVYFYMKFSHEYVCRSITVQLEK